MLRVGLVAVLAGACALAGTALPSAASAGAPSPRDSASATGAGAALSTRPAAYPPFLASANSTIRQLVAIRASIYAVGTFSRIGRPGGHTYTRHNLFAFTATTGALRRWAPRTNGTVYAATRSADGEWLYIGGDFTTVNGRDFPYLAKLSSRTGALDRSFRPRPNRPVMALQYHQGHLLAGGTFTAIGGAGRTALASLNARTGRSDRYVHLLHIRGTVSGAASPGLTRVVRLVRNHARTKLLALGSFSKVSSHPRQQAFMVDLGPSSATLDAWNPPQFRLSCDSINAQYVRAAAWGPHDDRIAVADTGGKGVSPLCDAVALYSSHAPVTAPLWVNRTGCDSLYSVLVTKNTVYVGGHERWLDNRTGCNFAGQGAVWRPGIGAVSKRTGLATAWNPTRDRGVGADGMLLLPTGLWIASDNLYDSTRCGGAYHPGLCLFPWIS